MERSVRVAPASFKRAGEDERRTGVSIAAPYSDALRTKLKRLIPADDRAWLPPPTAKWWVAEEYAEKAIALVCRIFGETIVVDENGDETYRERDGSISARQERLF